MTRARRTKRPEQGRAIYRFTVKRAPVTARAADCVLGRVTTDDVAMAGFLRHVWEDLPSDREAFVCVALDARSSVIGYEVVAIGHLTGVEIHPRELLRAAILIGAAAIVVAHNHPSGDPTPSQDDHLLTRRIREACDLIGIPLVDHLVIGDPRHGGSGHFSFASAGALGRYAS